MPDPAIKINVVPPFSEARVRNIVIAPGTTMRVDPEYEAYRLKFMSRLLVEFGQTFRSKGLPIPYGICPIMPPGKCYENAGLASQYLGLTYCEGVMIFEHPGYGVHSMPHAWCVDTTGRVLDPTCQLVQHQSFIKYLGIPFKSEYVNAWYAKMGFHGMLDGHPELGDSVGVYKDDPALWLHPLSFKE